MSKRPRATEIENTQQLPGYLKNDKELRMLNDLTKKGTLFDKVSAIIRKVEITYRPDKFCDFNSIDTLLTLAKKKSRHHSDAAIDGLKELFIEKLRVPREKPDDKQETKKDDKKQNKEKPKNLVQEKILEKYREFIDVLKESSTVEHSHKHMIRVMGELVMMKQELRDKILEEIINKLGDPLPAIPTCVILECNTLVRRRRFLLPMLLRIISRFAFRKNQSVNAKFYAIVLINSIKLRLGENEAVKIVIQTLLKLFTVLLKEARQQGNKTIALLLKTLNKTFPLFSEKGIVYQDFFKNEINDLYSLTHHQENINIQIESIRFILQMEMAQGSISDRYYRSLYEHILPHPRIRTINYNSLTILFNTIMISLKEDFNITRIKAFLKRILQGCLISDPPFILGSLLLVSEIMKIHPGTYTMIDEAVVEDEEEKYEDIPDSETEEIAKPEIAEPEVPKKSGYDPLKREPKFSGAEYASFFELKQLTTNLHPAISKWADLILHKQSINYEGDPLLDYSLINFLDRFAFRNPKSSIINKLKGKKVRMSLVEDTVNSKLFRQKPENDIREEEVFFHKYFSMKKEEPEIVQDGDSDSDLVNFEDVGGEEDCDFDEAFDEEPEIEIKGRKKQKKSVFADADEFDLN